MSHDRRRRSPLALSDQQLARVMIAANALEPSKRAVLLERLAARLRLDGSFDDNDLDRAIAQALRGLTHSAA